MENTSIPSENSWNVFGQSVPKTEIQYLCQIIVIYVVIITCIVNLSIDNGDSNLWTALLSSSLGYLLPNPTLKKKVSQQPKS